MEPETETRGIAHVVYLLSEAGRKAALLAAEPATRLRIDRLPATAALLEHATVGTDGRAWLILGGGQMAVRRDRYVNLVSTPVQGDVVEDVRADEGESRSGIEYDAPMADEAAVLAALAADRARRAKKAELRAAAEAEKQAAEEAERQAAAARPPAMMAAIEAYLAHDDTIYGMSSCWDGSDWTLHAKEGAAGEVLVGQRELAKAGGSSEIIEQVRQEVRRRHEASEQASKERREKEAAAKKQEMLDWIAAHGSERLKLAVKLGMLDNSMGIYRDERLAKERPGWQWDRDEDKERGRINPGLDELRYLEDERARDPGVALSSVGVVDDDDGNEIVEWRPALVSEFLGRRIVKFLDNRGE